MNANSRKRNEDLLGKRLKIARIERGLSQAEISKKVGISVNYVSLIENGKKFPSLRTLANLAEHLGVSTASLLDDDQLITDLKKILEVHDVGVILKGLEQIIGSIEKDVRSNDQI